LITGCTQNLKLVFIGICGFDFPRLPSPVWV
jgi:hypothetical protein